MSKVSIIIPVYNASKFVAETIKSVVNQNFEDWELIVVDDGSTDSTSTVLEQFSNHTKIEIISVENSGVSQARNFGYDKSKGEYIAYLDSDDVWLENNLELKVRYLEENKDLGLVHSDVEIVDEHSKRTGDILIGKEGDILEDLLLWNGTCVPGPSSILVRRSAIEEVGGFNPELSTAADQEFFFRVSAKYKIGRVPKITSQYRIHSMNMHQNIKKMESDHILTYRLAEKNGLFKSNGFRRKCFSNMYLILAGSWWGDANKNIRTFLFLWKSLILYPLNFGKLLKKLT